MEIEKKDVVAMYNLPSQVVYCRRCTISNQRPRISLDEDGICSACKFSDYKRTIDWEQRDLELKALCDQHRKDDGSYDVIVPVSGGKDGGFVAHMLKYRYGMHPLLVTWSPHLYTNIGRQNIESLIKVGGFDHVLGTVNGKVHRLMSKLAFLYLGDNFQPFIYGQTNFPLKIAVTYNIQLIMYGENGEVEYGGDMKNANSPTRTIEDHDDHYFSGKPPEFWKEYGVSSKEIYPYRPPSYDSIMQNKTEIHFFSYYHFWDPQENFYYCVENTGFRPNDIRSEGTYSKYASLDDKTDGFHYFLSFIKFGIGRATNDSAHEVRDGKITRSEAVALVKKYDGEFPKKYFDTFLDYIDITEEVFFQIIDSWRSSHIWWNDSGEWKLKYPIWNDTNDSEEPTFL